MKVFNLFLTVMMAIMFAACPPPTPEEGGQDVVQPESITVSAPAMELSVGAQLQLTASVLPAKADQTVKWVSGDTAIAVVDASGRVTGIKEGTVSVSAVSSVKSSVRQDVELTITPATLSLQWKLNENESLVMVLSNVKTTMENGESAVVPAKISVLIDGQEKLAMTSLTDSHEIEIGSFNSFENTFDVELKFYDAGDVDITDEINHFPSRFSPNLQKKEGTMTPVHINILRKTTETGAPVNPGKCTVSLSYPDIIALLSEVVSDAVLDASTLLWTTTLNAAGLATPVTASGALGDIKECDLDLNNDYSFTPDAKLLVASPAGVDLYLVNLKWGSDTLLGDSVFVRKDREFPEFIWLKDSPSTNETGYSETEKEGYTKYVLSWGDDFNYPFNGLNYKNNSDYLTARGTEGDPAFNFARLWGCENLEKGSHARKSGVWDFRTVEAKNGMLLSKHMAADADAGIFYLGPNKTKPLSGFTDICGTSNSSGFVKNFISGAAVTNQQYGQGYFVAKLRTRYRGYSTSKIGNGAWFAFWLHGPVHEFDLMEQTAGNPKVINYVNQYHNGWGKFGATHMTNFYVKLTAGGRDNSPETDIERDWWKLSLRWTPNQVIYYYNDVWAHYYTANEVNTQASLVTNTIKTHVNATQALQGSNSVDTSQWQTTYTEYGYSGILKAVPSAPVNVFLSTEIGPGWGGTPTASEISRLPVWTEADYIAYYVPADQSGN